MGKASSSKKVARAARAGGSSGPKQRKLAFPAALVAIVVLGVALVVFARADYTSAAATAPVANQDHWHAAYGLYVCDEGFKAPIVDVAEDTTGIHTHGDGIIHIHPFTASAAGKNATLAKWGEIVGIDFGSDSITMPDGVEYKNGFACGDNTDTEVGVWVWNIDDPDAPPTHYTENFGDVRLTANRQAITFGIVPKGETPPQPPSAADIDRLDPATDELIPAEDPNAATTDSSLVTDPNAATTDSSLVTDPNAATTDSSVVTDPNASTTTVPQ